MAGKTEKHIVSVSAIIPARRERVYSLLANYRDGHPRILPKQFSGLVVEEGGIGGGTVIRFQMTVLGRKRNFHAAVLYPKSALCAERRAVQHFVDAESFREPRRADELS